MKRLSLYWYATEPNFGDSFLPMAVEHCFVGKVNHGGKWCADIAACAEVFSSSLHGLVAADALGIPNRWVALRTSYASDERNRFKFEIGRF